MIADLILLLHFALAAFIVLGLPLVWVGAWLAWDWTRKRGWRYAHAAAILVVAAESLAGSVCPLTHWENALRGRADEASFIGSWVSRLLYYDFPESTFTLAYVVYASATLLSLFLIPPGSSSHPSR